MTDGNHRMRAAIKTGNPDIVNKLIANGRWSLMNNYQESITDKLKLPDTR